MTNYLFSYDISDTKLRGKVAKTLLQAGCVRIQKSVFFVSDFQKGELKTLRKKLSTLLTGKTNATDSLLCVVVDKKDFTRMIWITGEEALIKDAEKRYSKLF